MRRLKTVVVPLDGSQLAEATLPMATELVHLTSARLVLLRVFEEFRPNYDERRHEIILLDPANPQLERPPSAILEPVISQLPSRRLLQTRSCAPAIPVNRSSRRLPATPSRLSCWLATVEADSAAPCWAV
jgi:hypothetical protein